MSAMPSVARAMRLGFLFAVIWVPAVLAVPSATDFSNVQQQVASLQDHPPSVKVPQQSRVWPAARGQFFQFIRNLFHRQEPELPLFTPPEHPKLPARLLAQYGRQLVLRFNVTTNEEASSLAEACSVLFLDVWGHADNWVDIRLEKDVVPSLLGLLPPSMQTAHRPLMQGFELVRAIAETYPQTPLSTHGPTSADIMRKAKAALRSSNREDASVFFEDYRPLAIIHHWMELLQLIFPDHVEVTTVGSTSENRDIYALRLGAQSVRSSEKRKTVIVSAGQHAREWVSTSTVTYVAYQLAASYGRDPSITEILDDIDIILIPTLNPDGYHYTWESDRLWRKNRQSTAFQFCRGIDLDRTWDYKWDGSRTIDNPCSESFAGKESFDAVESRTFAKWAMNEVENNGVTFVGLLDLHSYSQQILYPYSYACDKEPPTLEDLQELGHGLAKAIRGVSHEVYKISPACEGSVSTASPNLSQFGGGGGSALDWFYHEMKVRKAYQIKLRDKGSYGFLLPKQYIIPTGQEILRLVEHFGKTFSEKSPGNTGNS